MVDSEKTFLQEALDILRDVVIHSDAFLGGTNILDRIVDLDDRITVETVRHNKVMSEQLKRAKALEKRAEESLKRSEALVERTKTENNEIEERWRKKGPRPILPSLSKERTNDE